MDAIHPFSFEDALERLKAAGEATRLRLLALLSNCELTVSDLTLILGQSQPRISRHLKLLCDAGLVERFPEGAWVYYRLVDRGASSLLVKNLLTTIDAQDPQLARDQERLTQARKTHQEAANSYFDANAKEWDEMRARHVPEEAVEMAIRKLFDGEVFDNHLDVGTGTGRMIELFKEKTGRSLGVDANPRMLSIARNKLGDGDANVQVRHADVYNLSIQSPSPQRQFDLVTVHQVLHYLDDPARALSEVARVTRSGGKWIIVDFAAHSLEFLRTDYAHRRLGFSDEQMIGWIESVGMQFLDTVTLKPETVSGEKLTVTIWTAVKP